MITEDYVSFEIAKLLKDKGFSEWCSKCYGVAVLHNGADISFDEECELKDEGRGDEIEYVEGGRLYDYGCNNHDKDAKVWAAPTLWAAMKWLRKVHHIAITIDYANICGLGFTYSASVIKINDNREIEEGPGLNACVYGASYEEVCEAAIKYCLEILI